MKKMLRDWLLTVGVRQNQKNRTHDLKNDPDHTVLCMKGLTSPVWTLDRWWLGIPTSAWNESNRVRFVILQFGMHHAQCQDVDLWSNIRTIPIWRITRSESLYNISTDKSLQHVDRHIKQRLINLRNQRNRSGLRVWRVSMWSRNYRNTINI